jgi:hypothetical protein
MRPCVGGEIGAVGDLEVARYALFAFAALRLFGKLDPRRCYVQKLTGLSVIAGFSGERHAVSRVLLILLKVGHTRLTTWSGTPSCSLNELTAV